MAINPVCDFCKTKLNDFGGLLFSPPGKENKVKKYHICKSCYRKIIKDNVKS